MIFARYLFCKIYIRNLSFNNARKEKFNALLGAYSVVFLIYSTVLMTFLHVLDLCAFDITGMIYRKLTSDNVLFRNLITTKAAMIFLFTISVSIILIRYTIGFGSRTFAMIEATVNRYGIDNKSISPLIICIVCFVILSPIGYVLTLPLSLVALMIEIGGLFLGGLLLRNGFIS